MIYKYTKRFISCQYMLYHVRNNTLIGKKSLKFNFINLGSNRLISFYRMSNNYYYSKKKLRPDDVTKYFQKNSSLKLFENFVLLCLKILSGQKVILSRTSNYN